jgi:hypothetical protein
MLAAGKIIATSSPSTTDSTDPASERSLLLHLLFSPYTVITSTSNTYDRSQNKFKQNLPYITTYYINTTILYCYYLHYQLIQHSCYQPPLHGYHQHLQHGLGQHTQHDDREEGSPSGIQELLEYLQRNKNTRFYLTQLKSHAYLASIQSYPLKVNQFHPNTAMNHIIYKNYVTMLQGPPFPHAPESPARHNAPSLITDEELVMLGQPWRVGKILICFSI